MERTLVKDIKEKLGQEVRLEGWVQSIRDQGSIKFLMLRDRTGLIQGVILKSSEAFKDSESLTVESVIDISGNAKEEKQAPGGYEIEVTSLQVLSHAEALPIPVVVEKGGDEVDITKRLDWRWLDLRRQEKLHIFKTWTALEAGAREYFLKNDFVQIYTPAFMSAPSESGAEVFEASYFEGKAYLAQSPQFYKQLAMASGFEKVFMTGAVFRAEPSFTTRHMTEFTGWDFEISFIESHHDIMNAEEEMLIAAFERANKDLDVGLAIPKRPFPRIPMSEAKKMLREAGIKSEKEYDVSPEEERAMSQLIKKEHNHDFVFLTDWHKNARPFYHMRYEDNPDVTKSFDLLYKGLEITTGAQREHRYDVLKKQADEKGMNIKQIQGYLNYFRYGCPPHGGVGIGPGRIVMQVLDLPNVKEATFLPRDVKRLTP